MSLNHGIPCDVCGSNIEMERYLCANCEDYNICSSCYTKHSHTKYHVFFRLDCALKIKELTGSHKILIQFLDPLLYPLRARVEIASIPRPKLTKCVSRELERIRRKSSRKSGDDDDFAED